jgi:hypothetical protein
VENHSECKGLAILENIVKNMKTSHDISETEQIIDINDRKYPQNSTKQREQLGYCYRTEMNN